MAREPDTPRKPEAANSWPALLRIRPRWLLAIVACFIAAAWAIFLAVDILDIGGIGNELADPMWHYMFNDHVVETSAWIMMALLIPTTGYLAGRIAGTRLASASTFFFLLAVGLGLMLVEDAGDVRHLISGYVRDGFGSTIFGLPYQIVSDMPYFTALAAIPLYAVLRYGRFAWPVPATRPYLVAGVLLYAIAAIGSGLRHLGDFYVNAGGFIDRTVFDGRFPPRPGMSEARAHYFLVDGPIEESVELFALTCLFAAVLAFAAYVRNEKIGIPAVAAAQQSVTEGVEPTRVRG